MNTEFKEWLETVKYNNSNILSPQGLAWEAWQAAQKTITEQRDRLATERDWIYEKWEGIYNTVNANRCVCGSKLHHAVMDELLLFAKYRAKYLSEPTEL